MEVIELGGRSEGKTLGLLRRLQQAAEEIDRNTVRGSCAKWMYWDPIRKMNVVRPLLFTDDKIYEEVQPGLYWVCTDIYQATEVL